MIVGAPLIGGASGVSASVVVVIPVMFVFNVPARGAGT